MNERVAEHPINDLLSRLTVQLAELRASEAITRREQAPNFTFFDFCDTSELGLSSIIAWLLDPMDDHEQGEAFLQAFAETFGISVPPATNLSKARVHVEATTSLIKASRRRIDIVVDCGTFLIGIENKPYAQFQSNQIADYCKDLDLRSRGEFALVILKGWTGASPDTQLKLAELHESKIVDSDYRTLQTWVRLCRERCRATKVSYFLEHFDRFIDEELLTGMSDREESVIISTVAVDRAQLLTALDLIAAAPSLYERLHQDLASALRKLLKPGWTLTNKPDGRERRSSSGTFYLTVDFDRSLPVVFACDLYDGGQHASIAIRERIVPSPPVRKLNRVRSALQTRLPGYERAQGSWLWWANASTLADKDQFELSDHNIWKAAVDPETLSGSIVKIAEKLETVIREAIETS